MAIDVTKKVVGNILPRKGTRVHLTEWHEDGDPAAYGLKVLDFRGNVLDTGAQRSLHVAARLSVLDVERAFRAFSFELAPQVNRHGARTNNVLIVKVETRFEPLSFPLVWEPDFDLGPRIPELLALFDFKPAELETLMDLNKILVPAHLMVP